MISHSGLIIHINLQMHDQLMYKKPGSVVLLVLIYVLTYKQVLGTVIMNSPAAAV